jgi:hypothetical protein
MKKVIKSEFRTTRVFESYYQSLYVNDIKTNVYYPEKPSELWPNAHNEAIKTKSLIDNGEIFPYNGDWNMFDICATTYVDLSKAQIVEYDDKCSFLNVIYRCTGNDYSDVNIQLETLNVIRSKTNEFSQWTKQIDRNNFTLYKNIGVQFGNFGYRVFFH